jgi:hypothetical protein
MDPNQFGILIDEVLSELKSNTPGAMMQLLVTAAIESGLRFFKQVGGGPALGFFQMEPATFYDLWRVVYQEDTYRRVELFRVCHLPSYEPPVNLLYKNISLAIATARAQYQRYSEPLPSLVKNEFGIDVYDLDAIVDYYIKYWRPNPEKTTPAEAKRRAFYILGDHYEFKGIN